MNLRRPIAELHLRVATTGVRAEARHRRTVIWAGEAAFGSCADLGEAIARLAGELPMRCRRVTVTLEHPPAQLRTLADLPPVSAREVAALVAHQAPRFFRKNAAPLVTDAIWVHHGTGRIARAVAVEEPVVEAIAVGTRAAGLVLAGITVADAGAALHLWPVAERKRRNRFERRLRSRVIAGTIGLWMLVGIGWGGRLAWERASVDRELAALARPLAAMAGARLEVAEVDRIVQSVTDAERRRQQSVAVLGALAIALPDSAVLTSLTWNADGTGILTGTGRQAADVLASLERGHFTQAPRLDGPVVRETVAGHEWDRFTIVFGTGRPRPGSP